MFNIMRWNVTNSYATHLKSELNELSFSYDLQNNECYVIHSVCWRA
jgi:hypothetical protein